MSFKHISTIILLSVSAQTFAASCGYSQVDMNICAGNSYQKYDKELNSTFKKTYAKKNLEDKKILLMNQRLWINYKEDTCKEKYPTDPLTNGSMGVLENIDCLSNATKNQIKELRKLPTFNINTSSPRALQQSMSPTNDLFQKYANSWCNSYYSQKYTQCMKRLKDNDDAL
jgi:uncharacterized protein YecT (DUF1311 family)